MPEPRKRRRLGSPHDALGRQRLRSLDFAHLRAESLQWGLGTYTYRLFGVGAGVELGRLGDYQRSRAHRP